MGDSPSLDAREFDDLRPFLSFPSNKSAKLLRRASCQYRAFRILRPKGLGSALLADAALRVIKGDVKAFALIVDAKDENALGFTSFKVSGVCQSTALSVPATRNRQKGSVIVTEPSDAADHRRPPPEASRGRPRF
jgi:hypothetical protein